MRWIAVAVALLLSSTAHADARVDRLAALAKVWGTVKFVHPYVPTRSIDWDAPLIAAIPKVRAATTDDEAAKAIDEMLAALGDPVVTRVLPAPAKDAPAEPPATIHRKDKDTLIIDLTLLEGYEQYDAVSPAIAAATLELATATQIVVDLRFARRQPEWVYDAIASWESGPWATNANLPAMRSIIHDGYASQTDRFAGTYSSFMATHPGVRRRGPVAKTPAADLRVVFLVNERAPIDSAIWTLQRSGHGFVVAQGKAVPTLGDWTAIELPGGRQVIIRTSEWAEQPFAADATLAAKKDGMPRALELARKKGAIAPRTPRPATLAQPVFARDAPYADMKAPSVEYRLLALYRVWFVIRTFYPYLHLIDDWEPVLAEFIPRFEDANTSADYARVVLELSTRVADSHTFISGHETWAVMAGEASVPAQLRWIEDQPVVTWAGDDAVKAGLAVGDVVVSVDGEGAKAKVERLTKLVAGSTKATILRNIMGHLLSGPKGDAVIEVRNAKGKLTKLEIPRAPKLSRKPPPDKNYYLIDKDIGYVYLDGLTPEEVNPMFEALKGVKWMILDNRGYPRGTIWQIAPRMNTRKAKVGAQFRRRFVQGIESKPAMSLSFEQDLPPANGWMHQAKTVMLIDERSQSHAEHSALFMEAANGTTFIGAPTAGANGDVTMLVLPGGINWMMTGHDVRHADGSQLQRVGIQPHIRIEPTVKGVRAGKDELLDRAIEYIRKGK